MSTARLPRIAIIGSRGIPASYGGFETFAEMIAVHLNRNYGYAVTVVCDVEQDKKNNGMPEYEGIRLRYSNFAKGGNAIRFYRDSIAKVVEDHDIIYSCGPAGGLFGPVVRRHGKVLITNPDGLNSKRSKWSWPVQIAFRIFEWAACRFSDKVICDSAGIETYIRESYGFKNTTVAEYGAYPNPFIDKKSPLPSLHELSLEPFAYHLVVSRLEPENNVEPIIRGYQMNERSFPLVVIGNLQNTKYVAHLQSIAEDRVRFIGGIYDHEKLSTIRANALTYIHGHSVGGTNPSLLEAMASRNLCICHDNIFNREVVGENGFFFSSADDVSNILNQVELSPDAFEDMRESVLTRIREYYNWDNMAAKYHAIFSSAKFGFKNDIA